MANLDEIKSIGIDTKRSEITPTVLVSTSDLPWLLFQSEQIANDIC